MWVIGSASNQAEETQSDERLRGRRSVNLPSVTGKLCCLFRIHVTRCCKVHVYNRKIKVTYFPGLDLFSGDHRDERRRPPPAPEVRSTQQPSKSGSKSPRGHKSQGQSSTGRLQSKGQRNLPKEVIRPRLYQTVGSASPPLPLRNQVR